MLVASGLITGEALMGLAYAAYIYFAGGRFPSVQIGSAADWIAPFVLLALAVYMIARPQQQAGARDEPQPTKPLCKFP